jgi:hypothetical protein
MTRHQTAAPRRDPKTRTWSFVIDVPGPDGKRHQTRRRGFARKREAQEELDRIRGAARTQTYVAPKRQTVAEFLTADWLPAMRRELAASTWESYQRNINLHIAPRIGGVQLQSVDGAVLNRLHADLLESGRKLGKQSPSPEPFDTSTRSCQGRSTTQSAGSASSSTPPAGPLPRHLRPPRRRR